MLNCSPTLSGNIIHSCASLFGPIDDNHSNALYITDRIGTVYKVVFFKASTAHPVNVQIILIVCS